MEASQRVAHTPQGVALQALQCGARCLLVVAPFLAFQAYGFWQFCREAPGQQQPGWCLHRVPYLYGHVQRRYWSVGLLRFYQWRQARVRLWGVHPALRAA